MGNADFVKSLTFDPVAELFIEAANALPRMQHESRDSGSVGFPGDLRHEVTTYPSSLKSRFDGDLPDSPNPGRLAFPAHEETADHFAFVAEG